VFEVFVDMKDLLLGLLIGGIIGLWLGVNLGKDQPLMTNPFSDKSSMKEFSEKFNELQKDVTKKSKEMYDDSKKAVEGAF
jgi:glucose-6-phosphate-specific signal transduction histidine kinase